MNNGNIMPAVVDRPERQVTRVPLVAPLPKRKRVAAYARVSAEKDASLHSLAAQVSYYSRLIQSRKDWVYAGVYADEGLSGTKENRPEFQRLLQDCRAGKIDMVLVKSISRFARNTVTMLETMRELKTLGVDIFFEKENIHSMSGDGELMLTILASFAQAESLSVSENCKWRIRKKFSVGQCPFLRMYGYRVKNSVFTVVPGEAEVVRLIYSSYLSGMGTEAIANMLNEKHIPAYGGGKWFRSTVLEILRNEKVAGNLLLQKTFRVDHLTKGKKHNKGELPQYSVEGAHDPIIDQTTFNRVKEEMAKRREIFGYGDSEKSSDERHPLFSKITCGVCGKHYVRKCGNSKSKYKKPIWICQTLLRNRKAACASRRISEKVLFPILAGVLEAQEEDVMHEAHRIQEIVVYPEGELTIRIDGKAVERHWENPSRALSWTDEMKQEAKRKERERQEWLKQHG